MILFYALFLLVLLLAFITEW